ncbi:MAG: hypothetical protein P8N48_05295 [Bacteroidales bacterium]|nr:phospholipase [Lentimicrobiaceae bacterium]MDG1136311.1 hypothetical protein [Bacteroidales bacterium]|tara:strand:+ start:10044 stop:11387 length:1344 start_codon:yes stop_codon:yes gene_type:complete
MKFSAKLFLITLVIPALLTIGCKKNDDGDNEDPNNDQLPALYRAIMTDKLVDADYWQEEPAILAAGLGFTDINGIPDLGASGQTLEQTKALVRLHGGGWHNIISSAPEDEIPLRARTSGASVFQIKESFGYSSPLGDGLPMELSHPVLASTVEREDILIYLNTGETVVPSNISVMPNMEFNERSTLVMNGNFGNRINPDEDGAIYPVKFEIVGNLLLVTPSGLIDAAGLTYGDGTAPLTAYRTGAGPRLCAAKLTHAQAGLAGEGAPSTIQDDSFPNDLVSLYGDNAQYRLRVLTTGGFSPDGVRSMYPSEFERYFRVGVAPEGVAADDYENLLWLIKTDTEYVLQGYGKLIVHGLAELGQLKDDYDDSYLEDHDNQIDIVLSGDEEAAARIVVVYIPAEHPYSPFYNPGGPGSIPDPNTTYSEPGPTYYQPVTVALDDPMQVSFEL